MKCRKFTFTDQLAFAEISGDYNPLHVDAVAARRLLFGALVVHGIHAVLWALDCCLADRAESVELGSIKTVFLKPIKVGDEVRLLLESEDDGHLRIKLLCGGAVVTRIEAEVHQAVRREYDYLESRFPDKLKPRAPGNDEIESDSGALELCLDGEAAAKIFPNLMKWLSPVQIAVILSTTRLVGVKCPGLHSIFAELDLSATKPNENTTMNYEVAQFDRRFGLVLIKVSAPEMAGTIRAFCRPAPQEQANYQTLKEQVESSEFSGHRALIIGGSRGLGEVAAKLLSGGGADVKITYNQGMEEASRIVNDIVACGGTADSFHFDVLNPQMDLPNISMNGWAPTHLYYFATPFIFTGAKGIFSPQLFNKFCDYYVTGFINTVNQVSQLGVRYIFYPSTVAIDELPADMAEYAAAKMASEMLGAFLEKTKPEVTIYKPRFPRVATDQTVTIMPVNNADPAPILLKELRSFRDSAIRN